MKMGVLSREKVQECLEVQKKREGGIRIGQILLELGLVDEPRLQIALAARRDRITSASTGWRSPPR